MGVADETIIDILEELDKKPMGKSVALHKNDLIRAYISLTSSEYFVRKIQGDRRGRLYIYLANENLLKHLGFKKGDVLKVFIEGNKIILEKKHD